MRTEKIYAVILTIFFLTWILVPIFNDSFHFYSEPSISKTENRSLARKPVLDISFLDPYPAAYEKYFTDHFIFRQKLLEAHSGLIYYPYRRSPIPDQVDIGKDGWLFLAKDDKLIYQGIQTLDENQVRTIIQKLHDRALYYRSKGIRFYVCFAPMSQEIYPEYLPNNYFRSPVGSQTDKVIAAIRKDTLIPFIDLKPGLINAKKFGRIYQKTDNHWNALGGFFAYSIIINRMKKDFPELNPLRLSDVRFNRKFEKNGRLAASIGLGDVMQEEDYYPVIRNARAKVGAKAGYPTPHVSWFAYDNEYETVSVLPDSRMPKMFVIRDSFFDMPLLYLRENFNKVIAIWDAWRYGANKELIEKEKPDIVLLMVSEPVISALVYAPPD